MILGLSSHFDMVQFLWAWYVGRIHARNYDAWNGY